jgi:hypothetical protein
VVAVEAHELRAERRPRRRRCVRAALTGRARSSSEVPLRGTPLAATSITAIAKRFSPFEFDSNSRFAISRKKCSADYDSRVSCLGTSRIIEFRNFTSAFVRNCIWSSRCFSDRNVRRITIVLLALVGYLVPSAGVSAEPSPESRATDGAALKQGPLQQYHGVARGQYHGRATGFRPISAWNLPSNRPSVETTTSIAANVISPVLHFNSAISNTKEQDFGVSRTDPWIGGWNDRSIGNRIKPRSCSRARCSAELETLTDKSRYHGSAPSSRNPRLMLQIGAFLGLFYLAFLAAWIWATRFRIRPPRSAGT